MVQAGERSAELKRLREIHDKLLDPSSVFSISGTLKELDEIAPRVASTPGTSHERGELSYLRSFVHWKAQRPAESVATGEEAVRIDGVAPFLTSHERKMFLYNRAKQASAIGEHAKAIAAFDLVLPLIDASEIENIQLGDRQDLAYCLHEARRYADARKVNEEVLSRGEKLHGNDSRLLLTVITNLAQNNHALGDRAAARPYLERRMAVAQKHNDTDAIDDTLFQLGVLSFEDGKHAEAEEIMKRRLKEAQARGNAAQIADAADDLDELYKRLGKAP